ncbi:MAG TPA: DUF1273 domain-containing protein [Pseudogracilibacillus sp.]|nr:DUF1273 domain-containing protein [Pseudogracilibacillus sp.]
MKIITVTGYKSMELGIFKESDEKITYIKKSIENRLIALIEEGLEWILTSGQLGVELWTAEVVLELQKTYDIKLAIIPAFENHHSRWPDDMKIKYAELIQAADFYDAIYLGDYKAPYQFKERDLWLINKSDACLILMDPEYPESTRYFHKLAEQANDYPIMYITPSDIDDVVEEMAMLDPDYWLQ